MAFVQRLLNFTFVLASGNFDEGGNTAKVTGLRASAKIVKAGGNSMGTAQLQIYGMTLSLMNKLSTLGMQVILVPRNSVTVEAGDAESGMSVVFQGTITNAYGDFQSSPDVSFHVEAHTGLAEAVTTAAPTSINGNGDVATLMSGFAATMGLAFENSGVSGKLSNPYFSGSPRDQAKACAEHAGISWVIDNGTLAIWPKNGARGGEAPLISPQTGMVSYPAYTSQGLLIRTIFNKSIGFGGKIVVQSELKPACGTWAVFMLDHDLESQVPDGQWFSVVQAYNPDFPPPVTQ